jgi:hypothetical protein
MTHVAVRGHIAVWGHSSRAVSSYCYIEALTFFADAPQACVRVCVYVYVYIYIYTYIHTYIHICIHGAVQETYTVAVYSSAMVCYRHKMYAVRR